MRQIVLDTETTGLSVETGDRLVEIGCVELMDGTRTGRLYQTYLNPECSVHPRAFEVHGLSNEFLKDKLCFTTISGVFLEFIGDAELIAHNAPFDIGFIKTQLGREPIPCTLGNVIFDTLAQARHLHPGKPNDLDALCTRYDINNESRGLHGALRDAELLAGVYCAMKKKHGLLTPATGRLDG